MNKIEDTSDLRRRRLNIEHEEGWDKWWVMPSFAPRAGWKITIRPPFGGTLVRFTIQKGPASVSVYFDPLARQGAMDVPYWEVFPSADNPDDYARFRPEDFDKLIDEVDQSLNRQILSSFEVAA